MRNSGEIGQLGKTPASVHSRADAMRNADPYWEAAGKATGISPSCSEETPLPEKCKREVVRAHRLILCLRTRATAERGFGPQ